MLGCYYRDARVPVWCMLRVDLSIAMMRGAVAVIVAHFLKSADPRPGHNLPI